MKNSGQLINPTVLRQTGDASSRIASEKDKNEGLHLIYEFGLTKREYFAGLAMQGMLSACRGFSADCLDNVAMCAIKQADELLKQLETPNP